MLNADKLRAYAVPSVNTRYAPRDAILYALGTGAGLAEFDETDLLFERTLRVLPTLALVLGTPGFWPMDPDAGLDWPRILHGAQTLRLARPLAPGDDLVGSTRLIAIADKGADKPALLSFRRTLRAASGEAVASMDELWLVRGAGGFGGARDMPWPVARDMPERAPDAALDLPTARNQAALYRLSGDLNPLHIDPALAADAGFDRPILHGLCTMGLVCRALVRLCCGGDPARLSAISVRFTAPVWPGDVVRTRVWRDGAGLAFDASVPARGVTVIGGGEASIDAFAPLGEG